MRNAVAIDKSFSRAVTAALLCIQRGTVPTKPALAALPVARGFTTTGPVHQQFTTVYSQHQLWESSSVRRLLYILSRAISKARALETLPVYIATAKSSLSYASSVSAPLFLRRYNREGGRLNAIKVIARKKVPEAVKVNPEFTENNCHRLSKSLALSKMTSCSELFTCH